MDRRYFIALLVSILILLLYPHYLKLIGVAPEEKAGVVQQKIEPAPSSTAPLPIPQLPQPKTQAVEAPFKNDLYEILFTNRGASILLLTQGDTTFYKAGVSESGIFGVKVLYETEDLSREIFQIKPSDREGSPPQFVYEKPQQYRLTKTFFVGKKKPTLVLEMEIENLSDREKHFPLSLQYALDAALHDSRDESMVKMVQFSNEELRATNLSSLRKKPLMTMEPLDWHGLTKKYYVLLVKPDWKTVGQETRAESDRLISELKFTPLSVGPGERATARILIYAGPQSYRLLKEFGVGFEKIFSSGVLGFMRVWLLTSLNFLYQLTRNYGVAILLITLLIKLLFTPLTHMSYQSMGKMQALQPKVKALQKQYQKDPTRMNKELMGLYKRNRVNPMGGCLPLVLQIPIFIAFYQVLSEAVELKGAPLIWWVQDLSQPDRLFTFPFVLPFVGNAFNLIPIFMIGSMLWQQKLTPQTAATPGQEKIMYFMPVIFGFVFYNLPSGLVLYWLVNNLLTIFHQLVIKRIPVILHHEDTDHASH